MKKILSLIIAFAITICLCACGDDTEENNKIYENFKNYIAENGTEDDYYIQISKTADSQNSLTEASKFGNDAAFMEYDTDGLLRYYRNLALTVITSQTVGIPSATDAKWEDFEFEALNEKYRKILLDLIDCDAEFVVSKEKNDSKDLPYSVTVKFNAEEVDTKEIFANNGNFGIINIKFNTDKEFKKFGEVCVSCQYDFEGVIYLYAVTFGEPNEHDENGKNGQRPEDIQRIYETYTSQITTYSYSE